jgi:hypothetical protein
MKHIIAWAVLAIFAALPFTARAANQPFVLGLHGENSAKQLSALIAASMAKDPSGNAPLQPKECRLHGACATPNMYFDEIKRFHKSANLNSREELAKYVGGLACHKADPGVRYVDRLDSTGKVVLTTHPRSPHKDEYVCQDTTTSEEIFMTDCGNVEEVKTPPAPAAAALTDCYLYYFDYRKTPGVVWNEAHQAKLTIHFAGMSKETLKKVLRDRCSLSHDADGDHNLVRNCQSESCSEGEWPEAELAKAVGLPELEPEASVGVLCKDGVCSVSLPRSLDIVVETIPCVDVAPYDSTTPGYMDWTATTRFDIVDAAEVERTLPAGRLDRVLTGAKGYDP